MHAKIGVTESLSASRITEDTGVSFCFRPPGIVGNLRLCIHRDRDIGYLKCAYGEGEIRHSTIRIGDVVSIAIMTIYVCVSRF